MSAPVPVGPSPSGGGPVPSPDWDDVLADIGDRVRAERQARRWSQKELASRAGLGSTTVGKLENGGLGMLPLLQACWAMNVQVDYLLSDRWRLPERAPRLAARQVEVLREAASGDSLTQVGARLGMDSRRVSAYLSRAYQRLGVASLPQEQRRSAAARVAMQHGLFNPSNRTS